MAKDYDHSTTSILHPIADHVIAVNMEKEGVKKIGNLFISSDQSTDHGIKPRWAQVAAVGPEQTEILPGQWILVEHGRWSRGVKLSNGNVCRKIDTDAIMMVSDEQPTERDGYYQVDE